MSYNGFFKRHRLFILSESTAAVLIALLLLWQASLVTALDSQKAAERWRAGDTRFAQLGAYFAQGSGMNETQVYSLRSAVDNELTQASITAESKNSRLWYDAYCGFSTLSVSGSRGSANVAVTGVGGDFFRIHNLELESGYYFSDDDLTQDRILLDATAAWQLFGSYDVAGMEVKIGERPMIVAGVVAATENQWETAAYGDTPRIYMDYTTLGEYQEIEITCYEAVMPDPVTGFAKALLEKALPVDETSRSVVENSSRYSFLTLFRLLKGLAESRNISVPVVYPWWENAARVLEVQVAILQLAWLALCVVPAAGLVVLAVRLWKGRRFHFADIPDYYERARERFDEWRRARKGKWPRTAKSDGQRRSLKLSLKRHKKEREHEKDPF
ncbi:MAG: ABC transporter permease [Clostridiaceae bacterium]|nr:ABC transporter permease [Clostridiaceae bacterium]